LFEDGTRGDRHATWNGCGGEGDGYGWGSGNALKTGEAKAKKMYRRFHFYAIFCVFFAGKSGEPWISEAFFWPEKCLVSDIHALKKYPSNQLPS
jgi:hypothetical protein